MDGLKANIASAQKDFNEQKSEIQDQAELGETAAKIAAKAPVSPETVIEGVLFWRRVKDTVADYAVPVTIAVLSVVGASVAYKMYGTKQPEPVVHDQF